MSILIKGAKMPSKDNWITIRIYPDGTCVLPNWQGDCEILNGVKAVEIPPHGRLIDADAFEKMLNSEGGVKLEEVPTVIEAEE